MKNVAKGPGTEVWRLDPVAIPGPFVSFLLPPVSVRTRVERVVTTGCRLIGFHTSSVEIVADQVTVVPGIEMWVHARRENDNCEAYVYLRFP